MLKEPLKKTVTFPKFDFYLWPSHKNWNWFSRVWGLYMRALLQEQVWMRARSQGCAWVFVLRGTCGLVSLDGPVCVSHPGQHRGLNNY